MLPNHHGRLLGLVGISLFALSLLNGFLVHLVGDRSGRQMLSAHLIGLIGSAFLIGLSSIWPRLALPSRTSAIATLLAAYGFVAGWLLNLLAALTGVYGIFPISAQAPGGHSYADLAMSAALLSVAVCLLTLSALVFRGLRRADDQLW
jgi:hypothetical protein